MGQQAMAQRRWYAEDLKLQAPIRRNMAIVDAFAAVARERFFGPGPWRILTDRPRTAHLPRDYVMTPDADPRWIHHDVLVAIDPARGLNNGLPSFWAANFDHLRLQRGQRLLQVGAGTGYYTAVVAEIVGSEGHVTAVEYDEELAASARANLSPWRQVEVVHGDGRTHDPGEVDVIIVFAGSTHPSPLWLDRLMPGGQLLMPLTGENGWGFLLLATRTHPDRFEATSIGGVGIFPCVNGRDEEAAKRLRDALDEHRAAGGELPIAALHHRDLSPEETERAWYFAPGFWLERKQA
ncbi:MAG: methyltransferase domain-containing protein [Bradyrhizobiaceae bacterium]|nr:methyltransferase domain-containing protein [Bradyrhizobiaceae bacterium]